MTDLLTAEEAEALWLSLKVSVTAVIGALPFALVAAHILSKPAFPGKTLLDAIIHLPLILPPVVMGYLLLVIFGTGGVIGGFLNDTFGIRLVFSWTGAALAAGIVTFPFQVRAIRLSLEAINPGLLAAANTLGASPLDRFLTISLPMAAPGILAGAITAFAASLGEFGAIITFVSNIPGETRTLPLAIYSALQTPDGEAAAARLVVLSIALALTGLILSEIAAKRVRWMTGQ